MVAGGAGHDVRKSPDCHVGLGSLSSVSPYCPCCQIHIGKCLTQPRRQVHGYAKNERVQWVRDWPGQVVLAVSSAYWTSEMEEAIPQQGGLAAYVEQSNQQIRDIVEMVRGKLPKALRTTLGALTTIDVHARDVVVDLEKEGLSSVEAFSWIAQLRYYW